MLEYTRLHLNTSVKQNDHTYWFGPQMVSVAQYDLTVKNFQLLRQKAFDAALVSKKNKQ